MRWVVRRRSRRRSLRKAPIMCWRSKGIKGNSMRPLLTFSRRRNGLISETSPLITTRKPRVGMDALRCGGTGPHRCLPPCPRSHSGIENSLHWVLDVTLREDECRIRRGEAAGNFCTLRHFAFNLLKQEKTLKKSIKQKRLKAGWDDTYREGVVWINTFNALALRSA